MQEAAALTSRDRMAVWAAGWVKKTSVNQRIYTKIVGCTGSRSTYPVSAFAIAGRPLPVKYWASARPVNDFLLRETCSGVP